MIEKRKIRTIRSQVYQILRDEITAGKYPPGFRLQEVELAEHLGVSRSPVREALRQLTSDGLLQEVPNRGVFVKEFTAKDIDEIFDMRILFEGYAIHHSRQNMTSAKRNEFIDILPKLENSYAAEDLETYTAYDRKLHNLIVSLSGNSIMETAYERVDSMNQQFRILSLSSKQRFDESLVEHREIVCSLIVGDNDRANEINQKHLELACNTIKEHLKMSTLDPDAP